MKWYVNSLGWELITSDDVPFPIHIFETKQIILGKFLMSW